MLGTANSANPAATTNAPRSGAVSRVSGRNWVISTSSRRASPPTAWRRAIRYASLYRSHGGGELRYIPALNDSPGHIKARASVLRRHLRGWAPCPRIS